jgi:dephospho-CoA kinase
MLRVGLTGGVGAGKSTVAVRLAERGAVVVDADRLAREVVQPGTPGLAAVLAEFGSEVAAADGSLDRKALARIVFDDPERRAALNAIVHPLVAQRRGELVAAAPAGAVVVEEIPLLVENGLAPGYPLVIVVHAPAASRLRRLARRGMPVEDARARIAAQATDAQRRAAADVWLDNEGPTEGVLAEVDDLWRDRIVPYEANLRHRRRVERSPQPVLVEPDPTWPEQAARLLARIRYAAGDRVRRADHIGSTSVPGLPAKDVIDVQVVVDDLAAAGAVADELHRVGLVRLPDRWFDIGRDGKEHDKAYAGNADPVRTVNVHIRPVRSPTWRDALLLRDWLRATPAATADYAALKSRLAAGSYDSIDDYAARKTPWINSALTRGEAWAAHTGWAVSE